MKYSKGQRRMSGRVSGGSLWRSTLLFGAIVAWFNPALAKDEQDSVTKEVARIEPEKLAMVPWHQTGDAPPVMRVMSSGSPKSRAETQFTGHDGRLHVGVAQYEQVTLELRDWPFDEFMYFLEGRLEITSESGQTYLIEAGDAIVVPKGFNGTWKQLAPIKKISVMHDGDGYYESKGK